MHRLRRFLSGDPLLAGAILALALLMKLVTPAGFMPAVSDGRIVVSMCSASGPTTIVMTIPGLEHGKSEGDGNRGNAESPCAFAGLSAPSLAAADPDVLAAAIRFVLAIGVRAVSFPAAADPPYLRPPLRGPPAIA